MVGDEPGLVVERVRGREVLYVRLSGRIDERFEAAALGELDAPTALDLSGVRAITSYGVRQFSRMLSGAHAATYLLECPPCIVDQLNLVHGFAGRAEVLSARALFACDCG